jgi:hypothetical protein
MVKRLLISFILCTILFCSPTAAFGFAIWSFDGIFVTASRRIERLTTANWNPTAVHKNQQAVASQKNAPGHCEFQQLRRMSAFQRRNNNKGSRQTTTSNAPF